MLEDIPTRAELEADATLLNTLEIGTVVIVFSAFLYFVFDAVFGERGRKQ